MNPFKYGCVVDGDNFCATGEPPVVAVSRQDGGKGGYSVSSERGSRRKGTMPMKVMPLRSAQGFS